MNFLHRFTKNTVSSSNLLRIIGNQKTAIVKPNIIPKTSLLLCDHNTKKFNFVASFRPYDLIKRNFTKYLNITNESEQATKEEDEPSPEDEKRELEVDRVTTDEGMFEIDIEPVMKYFIKCNELFVPSNDIVTINRNANIGNCHIPDVEHSIHNKSNVVGSHFSPTYDGTLNINEEVINNCRNDNELDVTCANIVNTKSFNQNIISIHAPHLKPTGNDISHTTYEVFFTLINDVSFKICNCYDKVDELLIPTTNNCQIMVNNHKMNMDISVDNKSSLEGFFAIPTDNKGFKLNELFSNKLSKLDGLTLPVTNAVTWNIKDNYIVNTNTPDMEIFDNNMTSNYFIIPTDTGLFKINLDPHFDNCSRFMGLLVNSKYNGLKMKWYED